MPAYTEEAKRQIHDYTRDLFAVHSLQHNTLSPEPLKVISANAQGIVKEDSTLISHDFLIEPLDPQTALRIASEIPPITASALKAQDIWDRLNATILNPPLAPPPPPVENDPTILNAIAFTVPLLPQEIEPAAIAIQPASNPPSVQTATPVQQPPLPPPKKPKAPIAANPPATPQISATPVQHAPLPPSKKPENPTAPNQPAARAPIALVPAAPEPIESAEPITSYIDFAFPELLKQGLNGKALYKQLPKDVQRDLIRHLYYLELAGDIEKRVEKAFKKSLHKKGGHDIEAFYMNKLRTLDQEPRSTAHTDAQQRGEEILELYYQGTPFTNPALFAEKVREFPPKKRFLGYMRELAIAAEVEAAANQHNWARKHYKNPHFAHLTVQALERYLHTS